MTIKVVYAPPRVGKSYHTVHTIEKTKHEYTEIFHNIDGYKPEGFDQVHNWFSLTPDQIKEKLQNTEFWEKDSDRRTEQNENDETKQITSLVVLDEGQRFFPSVGLKSFEIAPLLYFLEYHGHYELDVILISQSYKSFHSRVFPLLDQLVQISKVRYTIPFYGTFYKYTVREPSTFDSVSSGYVKFDDNITSKYKSSASGKGLQAPTNPIKNAIGYVLISVVAIGLVYNFIFKKHFSSEPEPTQQTIEDVKQQIDTPKPKKKERAIQASYTPSTVNPFAPRPDTQNTLFTEQFDYRINYRKVKLTNDCKFVGHNSYHAVCETDYDKELFKGHNYYCDPRKKTKKCYLTLNYHDIQAIAQSQGLKKEPVYHVGWLQENAPPGTFDSLSSSTPTTTPTQPKKRAKRTNSERQTSR